MALHLVTDFYFYAGVLGRKVAKVHSAFIDVPLNLPCSFCKGRTMGIFRCRERSDFVFSLEKYYLICLPQIDFQWCFLKSGLVTLLGDTADDMLHTDCDWLSRDPGYVVSGPMLFLQ